MNNKTYIGRFAPSPTGPLHYGTMVAAIASFLQARAHDGKWLLRIEDVDTGRCIKGVDTQMLNTLEAFAMHWDGEVVYQSQRTLIYEQALYNLEHKNLIYPCTCSRRQLIDETGLASPVYPGTCKGMTHWPSKDYAVRLKVPDEIIQFDDAVYARQQQQLADEVGDFIIKRRDGLFAYQLAVVVDDAAQGISEVVRGADLLDSTARQMYLQRCLGYAQPDYLHLPLVLDEAGNKLGKSTGAAAIDNKDPRTTIISILNFLGQSLPAAIEQVSLDELWQHAIALWNPGRIPMTNKQKP
jgi:glutamyl-Q tRNA(Asp) synthetase